MKKYKIYVTNNLNFFTSRFLNFRYIFAIQNPSPGGAGQQRLYAADAEKGIPRRRVKCCPDFVQRTVT